MKAKLMGIQKVDFVSEETGERIVGTKIHVVSLSEENDDMFIGTRVAVIFTKLDVSKIKPGAIVELVYEHRLGSNRTFLTSILPAS